MREHVLVLRPGAIGDTLVTLPALLALRRRFPEAEIQFFGNAAALPIVEASGTVDLTSVEGHQVYADPAGHPFCIGWGHPDDEAIRRYSTRVPALRGASQSDFSKVLIV